MLTHLVWSDEGDRMPREPKNIRRRQSDDGSWRLQFGVPGALRTSIGMKKNAATCAPAWTPSTSTSTASRGRTPATS